MNKNFLLYGLQKTNRAVKKFFDFQKINYIIYLDKEDQNISKAIFLKIDYIVKSPGIKFDTPFLKEAKKRNIPIISDLELLTLFRALNDLVVITGSNGKTTTTYLTYQMLSYLPLFKDGLGGNIGIPIFSLLLNNRTIRGFVIEASSFMLHDTYTIRPKILAITNLVPHHLDYHLTKEAYFFDKLKLIKNQKENDYVIFNLDDEEIKKHINDNLEVIKLSFSKNNKLANCYLDNNVIYFQRQPVIKLTEIPAYNIAMLEDVMIAIIIAKIYHIPLFHIKKVLQDFRGLPFRQEKIYDQNDLIIINDSKATSPVATFVAIQNIIAQAKNLPKFLILGGKMVDDDYLDVTSSLSIFKKVYCFGQDRFKIANKLCSYAFGNFTIIILETLEEVVKDLSLLKRGIILFSPSAPSYDLYESYLKRGEHFNKLINSYIVKT